MKFKITSIFFLIIICFSFTYAADDITIYSNAVIAMDADSGFVLYNKDMNEKIYPASTTKILTAILALENLDLEKNVVVSKTAINIPWDSSSVYLKEGEVISIKDLLYCLLLNSGNDAANVLAEAVSGDIESFVKLMNKKLQELGCTNTHFNNAHGYSDDNHYTTALDMAKIFRYCTRNQTFVDIISTKSYVVDKTNKTISKRYLSNTNRLIQQKEDSIHARFYEYAIGGKTGYTHESGRTLVTFGKKDGKTIIVGVFGASQVNNKDGRYTDAINLFEYSFNNFSKKTIAKVEDYNFNYINIDSKKSYSVGLKNNFDVLTKGDDIPQVTYLVDIDSSKLNIDEDDDKFDTTIPVGTITFNYIVENITYSSTQELYLKEISDYKIVTSNDIFTVITVIALMIFVICIICFIITKTKKHTVVITNSRKERRKS